MALFGTDFSIITPADSDAIRDGASQIRDLKSKLYTFFGVKFNREDGTFQPGIISATDISGNTNNGSDGSRAILFKHIGLAQITSDKLLDAGQPNLEASGGTYAGIANSKYSPGSVAASNLATGPHFYLGTAAGSANAIQFTLPAANTANTAIPALSAGLPAVGSVIAFKSAATNTSGTVTLSLDGGTHTASVKKAAGAALLPNDILSGQICEMRFDGVAFILTNPSLGTMPRAWLTAVVTGGAIGSTSSANCSITYSATGTFIVTTSPALSGYAISVTPTSAVPMFHVVSSHASGSTTIKTYNAASVLTDPGQLDVIILGF